MRSAVAVFRRELRRRRMLVLMAAGAAVVVFLVPLVPGLAPHAAAEVREATAPVIGGLMGVGVGILGGASGVARDLAEGRGGFDLVRPVPASAVWAGRFAAVLLLEAVVVGVVLVPVLLLHADQSYILGAAPPAWAVVAGSLSFVSLPFAGNAVAVVLRSRTRWLVLDAAGLVLTPMVAWGVFGPLILEHGADEWLRWLALSLAAGVVLACIVGSALQVVRGRVLLAQAHRWLSIGFWGVLVPVMGGVVGAGAWLGSVGISDLENVVLERPLSPTGWTAIYGVDRDRFDLKAGFLVRPSDGTSLRLPCGLAALSGPTAWLQIGVERALVLCPADGRVTWWLADLGGSASRVWGEMMTVAPPEALALSSDGRRAAWLVDGVVSVTDLDRDSVVAVARIGSPPDASVGLWFDPAGRLRIHRALADFSGNRRRVEVAVLDPVSGQLRWLFDVGATGRLILKMAPDGRYIAICTWQAESEAGILRLVDADSGRELYREPEGSRCSAVLPVLGGGWLRHELVEGRAVLHRTGADGGRRWSRDLGAAERIGFGQRVDGRRLLVTVWRDTSPAGAAPNSLVVDLETGEPLDVAVGYQRATFYWKYWAGRTLWPSATAPGLAVVTGPYGGTGAVWRPGESAPVPVLGRPEANGEVS